MDTLNARGFKKEKPEWLSRCSNLSLDDQKWIWDNVTSEEELVQEINLYRKENTNVSGNVNSSCKRIVNLDLTENKYNAISKLKACNYLTPPIETSKLLEILFIDSNSKSGHWLYIAQNYTPRTINRVIAKLIKLDKFGWQTINNPARYFTYLIKHRKKRKIDF